MTRLFSDYDFFSAFDRDMLSPRAQEIKRRRSRPVKCGSRADLFGDVSYDFQYGKDSDSDDSDGKDFDPMFVGQRRPQSDDHETFLYGFFYFFLLQDPNINQYVNLAFQPCIEKQKSMLEDLDFFNQNYLLQWV